MPEGTQMCACTQNNEGEHWEMNAPDVSGCQIIRSQSSDKNSYLNSNEHALGLLGLNLIMKYVKFSYYRNVT